MPRKYAKKDPTPKIAQQRQVISKIRALINTNFLLAHKLVHEIIIIANKKYLNQGLNMLSGDVIRISKGIYANNMINITSYVFALKRQYNEYIINIRYVTTSGMGGRKPAIFVNSANTNNNTKKLVSLILPQMKLILFFIIVF